MSDPMEWLRLGTGLLTPLVVLALGVGISRRLERTKAHILREREWQSYWATAFLRVAADYNGAATRLVVGMAHLAECLREDDTDGANRIIEQINAATATLSSLDWELQQYSDFATRHGPTVRERGKRLFASVEAMVRERSADLEAIRRQQFEFTDAVRLAHAEILAIEPNAPVPR